MVTLKAKATAQSPTISEVCVKLALDALCTPTVMRRTNPLDTLLLVEEAMLDAALPEMEHMRAYVLAQILIEMIRNELLQTRCALGVDIPDTDRSQKAAQEAIQADALTRNVVLLGWSWLYYHYVRVDLEIDVETFCRAACINPRTLQRYRQQALSRLTYQLIGREQQARKTSLKRLLYARLPKRPCPPLHGRDEVLKWIAGWSRTQFPYYFQVVGAKGVGKTALAQMAIRTWIDDGFIESLLWIESPSCVADIRQQIKDFLQEFAYHIPLSEYLQFKRTAFVIDDMDHIRGEIDGFQRLLDDLSLAAVFLTGDTPFPVKCMMGYVVLAELQEADAKDLTRLLLNHWCFPHECPLIEEIEYVWERAKGNPSAIVQAVYELQEERAIVEANCERDSLRQSTDGRETYFNRRSCTTRG